MGLPLNSAYTVNLNYAGARQYTFMPTAGFLPYVKVQLWGAGGGGGCGYGSTPGGSGAGGGYVEGVFPCERGQLIEIFIGAGGGAGTNSSGGAAGQSLIGYEGAPGGGVSSASSGAGGGGGGATVAILNCKPMAVAGGGGGGGGAIMGQSGFNATFQVNSNTKPGIHIMDQGKGWAGQTSSYYIGGGGGGGGGGISGGGGGMAVDKSPGNAGHCGTNGIYPNDPLTSGEYCSFDYPNVPGGYNIPGYPGNGVAQGGYAGVNGSTGGHGYAILTFYRESDVYVKDGNIWRRAELNLKMDGTFKPITPSDIYVKNSGTWKPTYNSTVISFSEDSYKFGGTGLSYDASYSVPNIAQPGYTIWPYFDQSTGCYFDEGHFYPDFRRSR